MSYKEIREFIRSQYNYQISESEIRDLMDAMDQPTLKPRNKKIKEPINILEFI